MDRVFLSAPYNTFDLLTALVGHDTLIPSTCTVTGFAPSLGRFYGLPGLHASDNATCAGIVVSGVSEDIARIAFFMTALAMRSHNTVINGAAATLFVNDPYPGPGEAHDKASVHLLIEAASEVMIYYNRINLCDVQRKMPMILARAQARIAARQSAPAMRRSATLANTVQIHAHAAPHEGFFLTKTYDLQYPSFDGGHSDVVAREVFVATDAAIILPYDPVRDRVLLVEQFRMGPFGRGDPKPWVLEPVAGRVDPNESPEATARRECEEEARLTLTGLEHVSSHYCSPGCSTEVFHCYVGLCDLPDIATGQGGLASEHEDIRTHVLSFEDALDLTRTGEANIGPLVLLLLWLQRERERLRAA